MRRLCCLLICLLSGRALAHGDEDHGDALPRVDASQGEVHVLGATGDVFEGVLKHPRHGKGGKTPLRVFIAEAGTNAPVSGVQVELTLTGASVQALKPRMDSPGVYLAEAELPVGAELAAVATITRGEVVDVLALGVVHLEPGKSSAAPGHGASATTGPGFSVPKETQLLLELRTERAGVRSLEARLLAPGKVIPRTDRYAQVSSPVPGLVAAAGSAVPLVGQRVKKGQVLATVQQSLSASESTGLATGLLQAEAEATRAQAALEQAQRDLARLESLQGVVAEKEVQQASLAVRTAEQELNRARSSREVLSGARKGQGTARFTLTAPIDGVLVEARATVGGQVDPSRPLFTVLDASVVWVEARVYENDVARVETATGALVHSEAYKEQHFSARLYHVGQVVDEGSRSVRVLFELDNREGRLRPGMFVDVAIGTGGREQVLAVPEAAVVEEEGRAFVFIHTAPESFERREVVLGVRDGEWRAVRRGVKEGERGVVRGVTTLQAVRGGR